MNQATPARGRFYWLVPATAWLSVLLTVLAFFGQLFWPIDLLSHFRMQFAGGFLFLGLIALLFRVRHVAFACLVGFGIQVPQIAPLYMGAKMAVPKPNSSLTVVLANVLGSNREYESFAQWVDEKDPDLLAILELTPHRAKEMEPQLAHLPYRALLPKNSNFGLGLYSKLPIENVEWLDTEEHVLPSLVCDILWEGQRVPFIATHPFPPVRGWATHYRNKQIQLLADLDRSQKPNAILVGDLNATPWSHGYRILDRSPLRDARKGFGVMPTWPTKLPFFLRIPIDHVFVGQNWRVRDIHLGPAMGSDHLPLVTTLELMDSTQ